MRSKHRFIEKATGGFSKVTRPKQPAEVYRVTYQDGNFRSDDPTFLTVSTNFNSVSWLPLISIFSSDPKMRWFDFPLLPGKRWSFRYHHSLYPEDWEYLWLGREWRFVDAEVIGSASESLETPAGRFAVTEIRRKVRQAGNEYNFKYFYSPKAKSAVRATLEGTLSYKLELVAYGERSTNRFAQRLATAASRGTSTLHTGDWKTIQAPVYEKGEWWIFEVKQGRRIQRYRVTFNGRGFESDDPLFLRGGGSMDSLTWLPLVSMPLGDPERKWFQFPSRCRRFVEVPVHGR